jgi:predicted phosphodiesterase
MKIKIISDLHIDFEPYVDRIDADSKDTVLAIVGDTCEIKRVGKFKEFWEQLCPNYREVITIPGNHEYYGSSFNTAVNKLRENTAHIPNLTILDREIKVIDDVTFIGATLWTDMKKGDPVTMFLIKDMMNDFKYIRVGPKGEPFQKRWTPELSVATHMRDLEFIKKSLNELETQKVVVLSHHAPSGLSVDSRFIGHIANPAYYSDLEYLFFDYTIDYWFHGHMHSSHDYKINNTRIICNPKGYRDENWEFNNNLTIDI